MFDASAVGKSQAKRDDGDDVCVSRQRKLIDDGGGVACTPCHNISQWLQKNISSIGCIHVWTRQYCMYYMSENASILRCWCLAQMDIRETDFIVWALSPMTNQYLKGNFLIGTDVKWRKIFYFGLYSPRVLMTKYVVGWAGLMMDRPYLVVFSWLVQTDSFDSFPELTIISIQFIFITDANIPWHASDMKLQNRSNGESNLTMMHKWNESKQMMNFTLNTMNNLIYDGV